MKEISARLKVQVILPNSVHIKTSAWTLFKAFNSPHILTINLWYMECSRKQTLKQIWEKNSSEKLLFTSIKIRSILFISEIRWTSLLLLSEKSDLVQMTNFTIDCKTCPRKMPNIFPLIIPLKFIQENIFMESKSLKFKMELKIYLSW